MKSLLRVGSAAAIAVALSGCGTMMVTGAIVTRTAVGAGTLAVTGTGAVMRGTAGAVRLVAGREDGDRND